MKTKINAEIGCSLRRTPKMQFKQECIPVNIISPHYLNCSCCVFCGGLYTMMLARHPMGKFLVAPLYRTDPSRLLPLSVHKRLHASVERLHIFSSVRLLVPSTQCQWNSLQSSIKQQFWRSSSRWARVIAVYRRSIVFNISHMQQHFYRFKAAATCLTLAFGCVRSFTMLNRYIDLSPWVSNL